MTLPPWLGDSIAKLRGYVEYLQDFPDTFGAVQVVTDLDDSTCRYLDLKDAKVQKAICEFNGSSAAELFTGPLSNPYKFSKLK